MSQSDICVSYKENKFFMTKILNISNKLILVFHLYRKMYKNNAIIFIDDVFV